MATPVKEDLHLIKAEIARLKQENKDLKEELAKKPSNKKKKWYQF